MKKEQIFKQTEILYLSLKSSLILLSILLIISGWQCLSLLVSEELLLPGPDKVLKDLFRLFQIGTFIQHIKITLFHTLKGFFLSLFLSLVLAVFISFLKPLRYLFLLPVQIIRTVPLLALIVLIIIWSGAENTPFVVAFLVSFPLIFSNISAGIQSVDKKLLEMAQAYQLDQSKQYLRIYLPALRPFLISAFSNGLGFALKSVIAAEILTQPSLGIGSRIYFAKMELESARVLSWTAIALLLSLLIELPLHFLLKKKPPLFFNVKKQEKQSSSRKKNDFSLFLNDRMVLLKKSHSKALDDINIIKLHKSYSSTIVLNDFNLQLKAESITAILGPSGCGKTSLLRILSGLERADHGHVQYTGNFSLLFQEPRLLTGQNVLDNINIVQSGLLSASEKKDLALVFLKLTEMDAAANQYPDKLSGGMAQRAALSRALAFPSPLLLLDEPFQNLDLAMRFLLVRRLALLLSTFPRTCLFISHDPQAALRLADRILLCDGPPLRIQKEIIIQEPQNQRQAGNPELLQKEQELYAYLDEQSRKNTL